MIFRFRANTFNQTMNLDLQSIQLQRITQASTADYSIIPDEYCVLGVQVRGRIHTLKENSFQALNVIGITGMMTEQKTFRSEQDTISFLLRIAPNSLAPYLPLPMNKIVNESIPLETLLSQNVVNDLQEDCLQEFHEDRESGWAWKRFLSGLKVHKEEPKFLSESLKKIRSRAGEISISSLASDLGISQSKLEKDYREFLGLSPKDYASLVRFRNSLRLKDESSNLTDLAYLSGYYDQAHFIREFKKRTGKSPKKWFRTKSTID
ncbi:AraC family transcriptional regulator [Leptospira yasudae]|uniref:AraC family transcriptional regulator n=2 Tax=Leptospira yasudae TaxID=2202201 RepID=A0ABX9M899_9LEPT|nr:AraC family transcriptional regulator [Leptospira yasudae]